jgi:uncharacterized alkaline shock family protein YloU
VSSISPEVLASYAADAAREVPGVDDLVGNALHRHAGVKIGQGSDGTAVELHVALAWGASAATVGTDVQERVADTLARMADVRPLSVDVVVEEFRPPWRNESRG